MLTAIRPGRAAVRGRGLNQGELVGVLRALRNRVLSNPALAQGSTAANLFFVAFDYMIDGQTYNKAASGAAGIVATGQGLTNLTAGQFSKVRIEVGPPTTVGGTDGPITMKQGGIATAQQGEARIPSRTPGRCTIGIIEAGTAGVVHTWGTTSLSGLTFSGDPDLNAQALDS